MIVLGILSCIYLSIVSARDFWPSLSSDAEIAVRSQRDMMTNVSIDQLPLVGVELDDVIFRGESNVTHALQSISTLLEVGVQAFVVDIDADESVDNLMIMNSQVTLGNLLSVFSNYISSTNNYLEANVLVILLRLRSESNSTVNFPPNMTQYLEQYLNLQKVYTPEQLQSDRNSGHTIGYQGVSNSSGWPTLKYFLYEIEKRIVITSISEELLTELPTSMIFDSSTLNYESGNATTVCPLTSDSQITSTSVIGWRFLESEFLPDHIHEYVKCGYSTVISNYYNSDNISAISDLLDRGIIWSWGPGQPNSTETSFGSSSTTLVAYRCAIMHYTSSNSSTSWRIGNCYDEKRFLCGRSDNVSAWATVSEESDYFTTGDDNEKTLCPSGYKIGLPETPLQQRAVELYLERIESDDMDLWIDLNCISVPNCWVTGGPYASCSYEKNVSTRNFVHMISPVSVFSFVLLVMVIYLNWLRVPIQDNRKSWKRLLNAHSNSEFEGVPS